MGWTGQGTSWGGLWHHRLFLQQALPLPHWPGVWGQWDVAGDWAGGGLGKKRPENQGKALLGGIRADSETRQSV